MTDRTVFHKIIDREIPAEIVYEDDHVLGFLDAHPKAPTHVLFIPKRFVESALDITSENAEIPGQLFLAAKNFAVKQGMTNGYRLQVNVGKDGGQEVMYLHLHFQSKQELKK